MSDWSSDVCSSDLGAKREDRRERHASALAAGELPDKAVRAERQPRFELRARCAEQAQDQIGRASCRERVGQYVSILVVAGPLQKKQNTSISTCKRYTNLFLISPILSSHNTI